MATLPNGGWGVGGKFGAATNPDGTPVQTAQASYMPATAQMSPGTSLSSMLSGPTAANGTMYGAGTGSTANLPGVGDNTFSQPLTDVSAYLDPSMAFQQQQGQLAIANSALGAGDYLSGDTAKALTNYSQGLASTDYNNAYAQAQQDEMNRYNVAAGDRSFNASQNDLLAQLGLQGTTAGAQLQAALAAAQSQNTIAAGQAQGAGTIGAGNQITNGVAGAANQLGQYSNPYYQLLANLAAQNAPGAATTGLGSGG